MRWKESSVEDKRFEFVKEVELGATSFAAICQHYGISRPTGYKWWNRYQEEGRSGLADRSRAPHRSPQAMSDGVKEMILAVKAKYSGWGAGKILGKLRLEGPNQKWPSESAVGDFLHRQGLTVGRKRSHRGTRGAAELASADEPNQVWCVDFKGWFRTGDGKRCDPLTLTDNYSRYLLCCQAVAKESTVHVKPLIEAAFREYGLPDRIRSDNGPPFGANGQRGLTALAVWWLKLGILPERIVPGRPQQNGRHERMHLTLKQETARPPAATISRQQRRFDRFRRQYNDERPHEALEQQLPASFYEASSREYPSRLPEMVYPSDWWTRRVSGGGKFYCSKNRLVFVSHALVGETIGFEPIDDGHWRGWFGRWELGVLDKAAGKFYLPGDWKKRHPEEDGGQ